MAIPQGDVIQLTGDPFIDGLVQGGAWQFPEGHTLTYSFHMDPPVPYETWLWTSASMSAMSSALSTWSAVADLHFVQVPDPPALYQSNADLAFSLYRDPWNPNLVAFAFFPDPAFVDQVLEESDLSRADYPKPEGDVFINYSSGVMSYLQRGALGYWVLIHELGHALGLKQPFDDGGNDRPTFTELGIGAYDDGHWTVMSYDDTNPSSLSDGHAMTPMPLDILAIQHIYGPNLTYHTGNDVYRLANDQVWTIWDAGGIDTIEGSVLSSPIDLRLEGGTVNYFGYSGAIGIAFDVTIENATGSRYSDNLVGNAGDNRLVGGGGNDTLLGGDGNDTLDGGLGADNLTGGLDDDTYVIDNLGDTVTEQTNEGTDTVKIVYSNSAATAATLSLSPGLVPLAPTGAQGLAGAVLGAGAVGVPLLTIAAAAPDKSFEQVENLTVTGAGLFNLVGSEADNVLIGNGASNVLWGLAGNDSLNGGLGADTLIGGLDDDTYVADNVRDVVTEGVGEGTDLVKSTVSYILGNQVENLTLLGTAAINGTGNALPNILTGTDGANILDGKDGADTLIGGKGTDTYVVDDASDVLIETSTVATEIDLVRSSVNFDLSDNSTGNLREQIENLTLTGAALIGSGNAKANVLTGTDGANDLDGQGGVDTLKGGKGDDTYRVDLAKIGTGATATVKLQDTITETLNEGTDTVILRGLVGDLAKATTLTLGANLENLDASQTGNTKLTLTGNTFNNSLTGNDADNQLSGLSGNDTLLGGDGNDTLDGGLGADNLTGGLDDDTYVIDNLGDTVTEQTNEGTDTVKIVYSNSAATAATLSLSPGLVPLAPTGAQGLAGAVLGAGAVGVPLLTIAAAAPDKSFEQVENLTVTGAGLFNLVGSEADNVLIGNGASNVLWGLAGNDSLNGGLGADTLIGGLDDDTYVADNVRDVVTEGVGEGTDLVKSTVSYILGNQVENLTLLGTAAINGTGNALPNILTGTDGANILDGKDGADTLIGGKGTDTYVVDDASDVLIETSTVATEIDLVRSSVNFDLSDNSTGNLREQIENLTLTGAALIGSGNAKANVLTGTDGANDLDGQGGVDTLKGGKGDDTYRVDLAKIGTGATATVKLQDTITETLNEGTDTVILRGLVGDLAKATTLTLGANLENLDASQTGNTKLTLTGNTFNNSLTGNDADNQLSGLSGNDTLLGGDGNDTLDGGLGADTLIGGLDDDTYVIDNLGDTVTEQTNEGTDTVKIVYSNSAATAATLSLSPGLVPLAPTGAQGLAGAVLGAGAVGVPLLTIAAAAPDKSFEQVENLTVTGAGLFNLVGSEADNVLIGNGASNVLWGLAGNDSLNGGLGADTLIGGLDDDTYVADNVRDVVTEGVGEGTDLVKSTVSYILGNQVENLTLLGTAAINGTGNALPNILTGTDGANILDGKEGADTLIGGKGTDTYVVDDASDVLIETSTVATEIDLVRSSVNFDLSDNSTGNLREQIENLTLTGAALIGSGNAKANVLTGTDGANDLDGQGGVDTLKGGKGDDTYRVDLAKIGTGATATVKLQDTITETLNEGTDTVILRGLVGDLAKATTLTLGANLENLDASQTGNTKLTLTGNTFNNSLTGNDADNQLSGLSGNDTLLGGDGNDQLDGGLGQDIVNGGAGNDQVTMLVTAGNVDTIDAGDGTDTLVLSGVVPGTHEVVVDLSQADQVVSIGGTPDGLVQANFENLTATGIGSFVTVTGSAGDNLIVGSNGNDTIDGGAGNDTLTGGLGNDSLTGGDDDDTLDGGVGIDNMTGGLGDDTYVIDNLLDSITELNNAGTDTVRINRSVDLNVAPFTEIENVVLTGVAALNATGNGDDNVLTGNSAANILLGEDGNDTLVGNAGNDQLRGGLGNDTYQVTRGAGRDIITENDSAPGNSDLLLYGATIDPLDLVLSRQVNDLRIALHGTAESVTIQNWYASPAAAQVETIQAGNGDVLLSTQVDQLIQAMAGFTAQTGLTWDQGIEQQPQDVQAILAASWQ